MDRTSSWLPDEWSKLTFRITLRGTRVRVTLEPTTISFAIEVGDQAQVRVRGAEIVVTADEPVTVPLIDQGPRLYGAPTMRDVEGSRRSDGTLLTASLPTLSLDVDEEEAPIPVD